MTENDLLLKIEGLEKVIKEQQNSADTYKLQLEETKKQLVDYNKPELTSAQFDNIHEAIENTINDFDFEDTGNYNIEYELDYDSRVNAQSLEFQNSYELVEKIVEKVTKLFKEAECPTDEENARDDKEAEELANNSQLNIRGEGGNDTQRGLGQTFYEISYRIKLCVQTAG